MWRTPAMARFGCCAAMILRRSGASSSAMMPTMCVDAPRNRVLVGYGKGALAIIDPATRTKAADIRLKGHPEGFQIDEIGTRVFVNVPDARDIEVVDLASEANRSLPTHGAGSNFPMASDA